MSIPQYVNIGRSSWGGVFSTSRRVQWGTDRTYITYLHVIHPERLFEWLDLFLRSDMVIGPGGHRGDKYMSGHAPRVKLWRKSDVMGSRVLDPTLGGTIKGLHV
jgi:hypothetical protein